MAKKNIIIFVLILIFLCSAELVTAQEKKDPKNAPQKDGPVRLTLEQSDYINVSDDKVYARGNVKLIYQDTTILADEIIIDRKKNTISVLGKVAFIRKTDSFVGDNLLYDYKKRSGLLKNVQGRLKDIALGDVAKDYVYIEGKELRIEDKAYYLYDGSFSSCMFANPKDPRPLHTHYHITIKEAIIYPQDKLIARRSSLWIARTKLFTWKSLIVDLKPKMQRQDYFFPTLGYNQVDGFFIKTTTLYRAGRELGYIYLDFYSARGGAIGVEHNYQLGQNGKGKIILKRMGFNPNNIMSSQYTLQHQQFFFDKKLAVNFQGNILQSETLGTLARNSNIVLNMSNPGHFTMNFTMNKFTNKVNIFQHNYSFQYIQNFSPKTTATIELNNINNDNAGYVFNSMRKRFNLTHLGSTFDFIFDYEKTVGTDSYYINHTPQTTIRYHKAKFPIRLTVEWGQIEQQLNSFKTSRTAIEAALNNNVFNVGNALAFSYGGSFRQFLYGTNEARHTLSGNFGMRAAFSKAVLLNLNYNAQGSRGYAPFTFDQLYGYKNLTGNLSFRNRDVWLFTTTTTYDLKNKNFQSMMSTFTYRPTRYWIFDLSSTFDMNTHKFLNVNLQCDFQIHRNYRLEFFTSYSPINKMFSSQNYLLTYEVDCLVGKIGYYSQRKEIRLEAFLKAFPNRAGVLSINQQGPVIDQNFFDHDFHFRRLPFQ